MQKSYLQIVFAVEIRIFTFTLYIYITLFLIHTLCFNVLFLHLCCKIHGKNEDILQQLHQIWDLKKKIKNFKTYIICKL